MSAFTVVGRVFEGNNKHLCITCIKGVSKSIAKVLSNITTKVTKESMKMENIICFCDSCGKKM